MYKLKHEIDVLRFFHSGFHSHKRLFEVSQNTNDHLDTLPKLQSVFAETSNLVSVWTES